MTRYKRLLNPILDESFFLFGARGTGKTSLLRELFESTDPKTIMRFDLLNAAQE